MVSHGSGRPSSVLMVVWFAQHLIKYQSVVDMVAEISLVSLQRHSNVHASCI